MTDFLASMPDAYARAFGATEVVEHGDIAARRGTALAHAELCPTAGGPLLCVVADDRPGLLALVTDALLLQGFGVRSAQAYCRRAEGGRIEAIDLLELQPSTGNTLFEAAELEAFRHTLNDLIAEDIRASARTGPAPSPRSPVRRVYFELEALRRDEYVLLVEAPDSPGLLHAVTSALYAQGVRIRACQIGTLGGFARDRFEIVSSAAQRLSATELCDIQLAVLDSLPGRA